MEIAIHINNNSHSNGGLSSSNTDSEQGEEESFQFTGIQDTVECREVDVHRIEDQLCGDQHGKQVTTGDEPEHANEKQQCTQHKETFYWYQTLLRS